MDIDPYLNFLKSFVKVCRILEYGSSGLHKIGISVIVNEESRFLFLNRCLMDSSGKGIYFREFII